MGTRDVYRKVLWVIAVATGCAALGFAIAGFIPFGVWRAAVVSSIPANYRDRFTPDLYKRLIFSSRWLATCLIVLASGSVLLRKQLERFLAVAISDLKALGGAAATRIVKISADGRLHQVAFVLILFWAVVIRLLFLGEPIRYDEAYTFICYVSRPLIVGLAYYTANNHLLNTMLEHFATALFGDALWVTRLPTFLSGLLLVPATYGAVRLFAGKEVALLTMALVSSSSPLIEYSFNARGYEIGALFFIIAIACIGFLDRNYSGAWIVLPIVTALSLYSVLTMVYGAAGIFAYMLLTRPDKLRVLGAIVSTAAVTLFLYAPVLLTVGPNAILHNRWITPFPRSQLLPSVLRELQSLWMYWNLDVPKILALLLGAAAALSLTQSKRRVGSAGVLLLTVIVATALLIFVQRVVPPRRAFLFLLPIYFATASAGIHWLVSRSHLSAMLAIVVCAAMGSSLLIHKSLEHDGIEATGIRSAGNIIAATHGYLERGGQFICSENSDAALAYVMRTQGVRYHPAAAGDMLILTPKNHRPQDMLLQIGIPPSKVIDLHRLAAFEDVDVYGARRASSLPFALTPNDKEGPFTFLPG